MNFQNNGLSFLHVDVNFAEEQKKLEARKTPENAAESPASSVRILGWLLFCNTLIAVIDCETSVTQLF